jgi:hypothetical protein
LCFPSIVFEQAVVGASLDAYHYSYPPVLLLLTTPLARMAHVPALLAWLAAGWYTFYRALRLAMPGQGALLLAPAAPAVFINAVGGQNSTWTAALFGGGLSLLRATALLAGGLLRLLINKPQPKAADPGCVACGAALARLRGCRGLLR